MHPLLLISIIGISLIYVWTLYHVPIVVTGVKHLYNTKNKKPKLEIQVTETLPSISVIVPVKNEDKVVGRLLNALLTADYPKEKLEIVVVEDGSTDGTARICKEFVANYPDNLKLVQRTVSKGKPSALMAALGQVKGEIIGVFDADNVPEPDVLLRAASHFTDSSVVAVQGRALAINAEENMLTKFVAQEETVRYEGFMGGKDILGLFVPLNGSCYFLRKEILEKLDGWDTTVLSEDMELAARLVNNGYNVKYASDVRSWQEYPASLKGFFKQRVRWFRGTMEVGIKYGKLLKNLNKMSVDTEITLIGPFVFISCLVGYLISLMSLFIPMQPNFISLFFANLTTILSVVLLSAAGIAMIYGNKPRKMRNVLWVPFVFVYWFFQNFIALYALLQILLHRPKTWIKTEKKGIIANSTFSLENEPVVGCSVQ
jgi:cellulose synthase/poly-beta-1,6-N-acetylglucosamine synthase-like glycosyltransferase